ncbi:hypothetical protein BJ875DRAFT_483414 [Amylocarpus encephaloides]|uniref:Uncharacterized protein n=1 Tax=Amylocarpus encephaloides TaxID=45428 RepID=A0A9P7YLG6_9HELO|nr:hypothetical protein BJ875DRAFT_483414 [Amylocarpus encephaloides]
MLDERYPLPGPSSARIPISRPLQQGKVLCVGLHGKLRVVRGDITSHRTEVIVNPSPNGMFGPQTSLPVRIFEAAGEGLMRNLQNRYAPDDLGSLPATISDTHDGHSPMSNYYNAIKHTQSFDMKGRKPRVGLAGERKLCDWIMSVRFPKYVDPTASEDTKIGNKEVFQMRNQRKYSSIFLTLKRYHLLCIKKRMAKIRVAIPQCQYDSGSFTPFDDAVVTMCAIIDFFNHPIWGAHRWNRVERVDLLIANDDRPNNAGAYIQVWEDMNLHGDMEDPEDPRAMTSFLGIRYPMLPPNLEFTDRELDYVASPPPETSIKLENGSESRPNFNPFGPSIASNSPRDSAERPIKEESNDDDADAGVIQAIDRSNIDYDEDDTSSSGSSIPDSIIKFCGLNPPHLRRQHQR